MNTIQRSEHLSEILEDYNDEEKSQNTQLRLNLSKRTETTMKDADTMVTQGEQGQGSAKKPDGFTTMDNVYNQQPYITSTEVQNIYQMYMQM